MMSRDLGIVELLRGKVDSTHKIQGRGSLAMADQRDWVSVRVVPTLSTKAYNLAPRICRSFG